MDEQPPSGSVPPTPPGSTPPPPPPPGTAATPPPEPPPQPQGGTIPPPPPPPPPYVSISGPVPPVIPSTKDERLWATILHLSGIVGVLLSGTSIFIVPLPVNLVLPLIIWLLKREGAPFIDDQGKETLNFNITITIVAICLFFTCVGIFLLPILAIYALVIGIVAAVKANEGVAYRYPATIRLIS